jgi:hypothetical protein
VDGNGLEQEIVGEGEGEAAQLACLLERRHQQSLKVLPLIKLFLFGTGTVPGIV